MKKLLKQTLYKLCTRLLFLQVINHLLSVLSEVGEDERDMHPIGAGLAVLPDKLIERQMVADILKYLLTKRHIALDVDVSGLPLQVLGVIYATDGFVQLLAAVAAADLDRFAHRYPQRLQYKGTEIDDIDHLLRGGLIVYTETLRRV